MAGRIIDVTAIGNAIVDVVASVSDAFLSESGIAKGTMTLVGSARSEEILAKLRQPRQVSGGSAANTAVGLARMGARAAFVGKVRNDRLGQVFGDDMAASGVRFATPAAETGPATARCLVLVTPDGQRSMLTYLGACVELQPQDIDESVIASGRIVYLEGYLWDPPRAKDAFRRAARLAGASCGRIALTLSDPFCVDRHRTDFLELVAGHVDILFANEQELVALFRTDGLEPALEALGELVNVAAVTKGAGGSVVLHSGTRVDVAAEPVDRVIDSTGAGDLYAAGFLYGLSRGLSPEHCGRLGSAAASEIIARTGARPPEDLHARVAPVLKDMRKQGTGDDRV